MSSRLHEVARTAAAVEASSIGEAVAIAAAAHRRSDVDERIADRKRALEALRMDEPAAVLTRARAAGLILGEDWPSLLDSLARAEVAAETLRAQASADEDLLVRFESWRRDVDSDSSLDTLTLALGYFAGAGVDNELANELALDACERAARRTSTELRALLNGGVL